MIEQRGDKGFVLICSQCGHEVKYFDSFDEAVAYKRDNGWISRKVGNEWVSKCPNCQ